ncbi:hypothetical protein Cgig2_008620 [Carnegiea gigantea]|uniref:Uncharacterized protein n=1 Tax=Carnegiea gigantea TaxID=171969 RepID=A0A9Q1K168_9CARY|nr:hypothetical protein Cgig2_008620 [Carnegiea gigantea]
MKGSILKPLLEYQGFAMQGELTTTIVMAWIPQKKGWCGDPGGIVGGDAEQVDRGVVSHVQMNGFTLLLQSEPIELLTLATPIAMVHEERECTESHKKKSSNLVKRMKMRLRVRRLAPIRGSWYRYPYRSSKSSWQKSTSKLQRFFVYDSLANNGDMFREALVDNAVSNTMRLRNNKEGLLTKVKDHTDTVTDEELIISSRSDFDIAEEGEEGRKDNVPLGKENSVQLDMGEYLRSNDEEEVQGEGKGKKSSNKYGKRKRDALGQYTLKLICEFKKTFEEYHKEAMKGSILKPVLEYQGFAMQRELTTTIVMAWIPQKKGFRLAGELIQFGDEAEKSELGRLVRQCMAKHVEDKRENIIEFKGVLSYEEKVAWAWEELHLEWGYMGERVISGEQVEETPTMPVEVRDMDWTNELDAYGPSSECDPVGGGLVQQEMINLLSLEMPITMVHEEKECTWCTSGQYESVDLLLPKTPASTLEQIELLTLEMPTDMVHEERECAESHTKNSSNLVKRMKMRLKLMTEALVNNAVSNAIAITL